MEIIITDYPKSARFKMTRIRKLTIFQEDSAKEGTIKFTKLYNDNDKRSK